MTIQLPAVHVDVPTATIVLHFLVAVRYRVPSKTDVRFPTIDTTMRDVLFLGVARDLLPAKIDVHISTSVITRVVTITVTAKDLFHHVPSVMIDAQHLVKDTTAVDVTVQLLGTIVTTRDLPPRIDIHFAQTNTTREDTRFIGTTVAARDLLPLLDVPTRKADAQIETTAAGVRFLEVARDLHPATRDVQTDTSDRMSADVRLLVITVAEKYLFRLTGVHSVMIDVQFLETDNTTVDIRDLEAL